MALKDIHVLIVSGDTEIVANLAQHIVTTLDARITLVDTLDEARTILESGAFDVIMAAEELADGSGLSLLEEGSGTSDVPFILLGRALDARSLLSAIRCGAVDVFTPPIETDRLIAVTRRVVQAGRARRRQALRTARLRQLAPRLIRDRRELRQRVDLICTDLVHAYRRLAEKVVQTHDIGPTEASSGRFDSCQHRP